MTSIRYIYLLSFLVLLNSCTNKIKFFVAKSLNVAEEYAVLVDREVELKPSGGIEPYNLSILPVSCSNQLSVAEKAKSCGEVIREQVKPGVYTYKYKAGSTPNEIYLALTDGVSIKEPIILLVHVVDQLKIEPKTKVMVKGQTITVNGLDGLKPYEYKITAGSENGILKSIKDSFAQELKATQVGLMKVTVKDAMGNTADASIEVKEELQILPRPLHRLTI